MNNQKPLWKIKNNNNNNNSNNTNPILVVEICSYKVVNTQYSVNISNHSLSSAHNFLFTQNWVIALTEDYLP